MPLTALDIQGLTKVYPNGTEALKGIDLKVEKNDFFALLGPNGAGKSTIIGIICSLITKSGGSVSVFGEDIDLDFPAAKQYLGIVPQEFNFNAFERVVDIVTTQAGYYGLPPRQARKNAERYLRELGLWSQRNTISRMLSGGMKRRLMIARALVHEPRLLILDEPSAGVDIDLRRSLWVFLRELNRDGVTIILTTHYLEEAESLCRNIAIIDHGEIIQNTNMRALLRQLSRETFVLDTAQPVTVEPELNGCIAHVSDNGALEVSIDRDQSLNEMFSELDRHGIRILSMRPKANRLEELFVSLTSLEADS